MGNQYHQSKNLQHFNSYVGLKFQLYNSLFTALPFHRIEKTGIQLALLLNECEEGYAKGQGPVQIIEGYFSRFFSEKDEQHKADLLFLFVQYVERQVVLFDALEDAAFKHVNDLEGMGSLKSLEMEVKMENAEKKLARKLEDFSIRLVLTAHPTQFYPGSVLGIINDLSKALAEDNTALVNQYLQQLGKTPFYKKQKPTPYDEAMSLLWYLENVFYAAAGNIIASLQTYFPKAISPANPVVTVGFWPGGDRDGNPNVSTDITLKVANALRSTIIKCYYNDVRNIKRRLTFKGVDTILLDLEQKLYDHIYVLHQNAGLTIQEIYEPLVQVREIIVRDHNEMFIGLVDNLLCKLQVFGLYFASLDIRQESTVHGQVLQAIAAADQSVLGDYANLDEAGKIEALISAKPFNKEGEFEDAIVADTNASVKAVKKIQQYNGEFGCHRYIISQCNSALNVLEVYGLFLLNGWKKEELTVDIVPLFETVDDLVNAKAIMQSLYENKTYRQHLYQRSNKQTIMVGFSDGTKDGGYLMANWSIYKAKEELTRISKEYDVDVIFFDGRGGPPARGGGKTHQFYASMGENISNKEIQLTIQGQTISSSFGTVDTARYNMEQLLHAGITNGLFEQNELTLEPAADELLQKLSATSYESYKKLKNHPSFLPYLADVSPLNFYGETNIGSRPTRRSSSALSLKSLRAIPFVGAWSQLKQNVTGYYGLGTALKAAEAEGNLPALTELYHSSLFFRTLIDNCEMAMKKCFFPLTAHLADHPQYGELWKQVYEEFKLTQQYLFKITGHKLMENYPVETASIEMRERIVLPLTTIQQYAIHRIREIESNGSENGLKEKYERLVVRCSFGIINAGRNSA
ncbi:phosphoenolpyruvate carboxylase [Aridibaculum aurantiacum]|uniref:phosphoenolpyruvate carboxylase n=1 Tax=Aridibaculum aurantiacum TaxID=2810307 RepID=UPI001A97285F|nr:phosphoenolpyruvate carboxylase [Aridibaculum aurantiacum]